MNEDAPTTSVPLRVHGSDLAEAVASASPDGILVVAVDGVVALANERFNEIWGIAAPLVGRPVASVLSTMRELASDPSAVRLHPVRAYGARDVIELRDGRSIERHAAPILDPSGALVACAFYDRDVTHLRAAENEQRALAATLQASLLPPRPPSIPGMDVATRFRAGDVRSAVGGDFFDVFRVRTNDWGVVVGDVCGKGARAAALTALARYSIRAAAVHSFLPSDVLAEVNDTMRLEGDDADDRFCSAVFARVELDTCGAWVTLAAAGHPRPVVVRRAGWIDVRGQGGTPLGMFATTEISDDRVGLGPGDALVLFTDGITEARQPAGEMFGDDELLSTLLSSAGASADEIADRIVDRALAFAAGQVSDDVAVVVIRVPETAELDPAGRIAAATGYPVDQAPLPGYPVGDIHEDVWRQRPPAPREARMRFAPEPASAGATRRFLGALMRSWRMPEVMAGDIELLATELATNAILHARSAFTVIARYDGESVRVEIGDGSRALPKRRSPTLEATGGRGLNLIERLATDWGAIPTVEGKRVWFTVPASDARLEP